MDFTTRHTSTAAKFFVTHIIKTFITKKTTMRKSYFYLPLLTVCFVLIAFSCKKGDTGPQGAVGPEGPEGPPGANVIYSAWLDVTFSEEDADGDGQPDFFAASIPAPKLTSEIVNTGVVKVYLNTNTAAEPYVVPIPYGTVVLSAFTVGNIDLTSGDDLSTATDATGTYLQYRYILIPGEEAARKMPGGKKINWDNYADVKAYLQIKD